MRNIRTAVGAVAAAITLGVAHAEAEKTETAELEEEESAKLLEAGFDFDFMSAYIWRNAVQNDEMVMQPCVWADFTGLDPFYFGFSVWQDYDLTDRRRDIYKKGLTETDYNLHVGATAWESDDETMSFGAEIGHEWYDNQFVQDSNECPDTRELYLKLNFDNAFVNVYGQASWAYMDYGSNKQGLHYEIGFNKEVEICDSLSVGADWNVSFGDGHYLNYLYTGTRSGYDEDGNRTFDSSSGGFGGTTVKLFATWSVTEWFSLGGVIAYTGVLNGAYRESLGDMADDYWSGGGSYQRDFVWGGFQAKLSF